MIVSFREMDHAANVELTAGPEYFIELNDRFRTHRRDIGAALAHEVMHVYLHRLDLSFPGTRDNEILTDTATTYLGAGWLLLDAFREDGVSSQKLGYLTPEEFGYVLAKRAAVFGEDPSVWFTSPAGLQAYTKGRAQARATSSSRRSPARAGRAAAATPGTAATRSAPRRAAARHQADRASLLLRERARRCGVSFPCPTCHQRIRVPVRGRCGPAAGCAARFWNATPEPVRRGRAAPAARPCFLSGPGRCGGRWRTFAE